MEGDVWGSFGHDPREPAVASLRASDADREVVHGVLAEAFADGRYIVMAATFLNLLKALTTREEIVASEVRRLERKQAKELDKLREP